MPSNSSAVITLLTDFGIQDPYVAAMKGVILSHNCQVTLVDISHEIAPGDIKSAAFVLFQSHSFFPSKTIHVVVVDPGVGSARKAIAVSAKNQFFIAPDNGVLQWIFSMEPNAQVRELQNRALFRDTPSMTFHGRDIFAPVAAHLSLALPFTQLGELLTDFERGFVPLMHKDGNSIYGEIIYIDRFGNAVTNIRLDPSETSAIQNGKCQKVPIEKFYHYYAEANWGESFFVIGSHGFIEIARRDAHAAQKLNLSLGDAVVVNL